MRQTVRRRAAAGLVASFSFLLPTALPASAASPSGEIVLDGATSAEGIAAGEGKTFYAGELTTGDIFRGDIRKGTATRFIDAPAGRAAAGMKADTCRHLLFVAGANTGKAFVYDTNTGKPVADVDLAKGFINDVTLTSEGAWFTNSAAAELYFLPVDEHGDLGKVKTLKLSGPAADVKQGFNLNGIAASEDGKVLIVAHSLNGALYTVNPKNGKSAEIRGVKVPFVDGILVRGDNVWAVQNQLNQITRLDLSTDLSSAVVRNTIKSDAFNIPTTVALFGEDTLAAVNAQFNQPPSPFEVVLVPAWK
ncbi:sugar lactone lactonase YvrE [Arthrobacter ulcerisalmonis]|nr:SMP-30/gluconolactonase/LRE family protein [Arthrobacter ulcerisalmonis]MDQ0662779.1 sugar lactone lactonase YvrE [Arthrobacter ulcerisalmonis]